MPPCSHAFSLQGFEGRLEGLRREPSKFLLHGAKLPEHFAVLDALYREQDMERCLGPQIGGGPGQGAYPHRFNAAQHPPLAPIEGYEHTSHGKLHRARLLARSDPPKGGSGDLAAAAGVLGASPWPDWPVFGPADCLAADPFVPTKWDAHLAFLRTQKLSRTALPEHSGGRLAPPSP